MAPRSVARRVDVAVVGGGAIGVACAMHIAAKGGSVVLLERGRIGEACSSGNAGQVSPSDAIPLAAPGVVGQALRWLVKPNSPFAVRPQASVSFWLWLLRFAVACRRRDLDRRISALGSLGALSSRLLKELSEEPQASFGYRASGLLNVYTSERGLARGEEDAELLREHGIEAQALSGEEARAAEPLLGPALKGAVHLPSDGLCDPRALVHTMAQKGREKGAMMIEQAPVQRIERHQGHVAISTPSALWNARRVVLACGAELPKVAKQCGIRVPIAPGKGYSVEARLIPALRLPLLLFEQRTAVTPLAHGTRIAGRMEIGARRLTPDPRRIASLLSAAREVLPRASIQQTTAGWAGLRPCTPDGLPIIGYADERNDVIVAGGHAMLGITLAAGTGALVSDLSLDRRPVIDPEPFRLGRFG